MNPLFLLIGGGVALYLLNAGNKANITSQTSQVTLTGIRINTKNIFNPYFELTFNIWNTVNSNLNLQAISGTVLYQGNAVASLRYADNILIRKGDNFVTVKAMPSGLAIMNSIIGAIGGKFSKELTVSGNAIINGVAIPIKSQL